MANLITEYISKHQAANAVINTNLPQLQEPKPVKVPAVNSQVLKDEFIKEHKKNDLFERFYNFLKNKTNFGSGSKTVEKSLNEYEKGTKTEEEVKNEIIKYRSSQKNGQQVFGDLFSVSAATGTYFGITNFLNKFKALTEANGGKLAGIIGAMFNEALPKKELDKILKHLTKGKIIAFGVLSAMYIGGLVKSLILNINRSGSKEFKYDKKNKPPKAERKTIRKAKRSEKRKNFYTGALNGLFAPIITIAGGIIGIPAFLAANFGIRYAALKNDKKSLKDFGEKLKDNASINTIAAGLMAIPMIKKTSYTKVLNKNLEKVVAKLKGVEFKAPFEYSKTAYTQLEEMLIGSPKIQNILSSGIDVSNQIIKLSDENIFAVKFMQISNNYGEISNVLRETCPSTRTINEAADYISKTFGTKYQVSKQLGVGTIAETYLAKDIDTGKEVCIKILKKGISAEKIDSDKLKMIELIKSQITDPKEQQYLVQNIEDLASGIRKEVDFTNEMAAAKELKKYTIKANVVNPIEVKNNIYVMEKANGISLKTLQEIINLETKKMFYTKDKSECAKNRLAEINEEIKKIKAKSPDFDLQNITSEQLNKMLKEYIEVNIEQFNTINKNGKVLHADIHPGNIFIDLEALRSGKGKLLTLIDTGNTVNLNKIQSENALKLTQYIERGNVKNITKYVLDGAVLPDKMTKEAAIEIMEKELNKLFFDSETKLELLTNNTLLELTSNIMRKYNILPSNTQLNFEKAKKSALQSFMSFMESFFNKKYSYLDLDDSSKMDMASTAMKLTKDMSLLLYKYKTTEKLQDIKNLSQLGYKQLLKHDKNILKTNSEDYLTYKFKQQLDKNLLDKIDI